MMNRQEKRVKAPSVIVLGLTTLFLVSTVVIGGCSTLQNEYSHYVQTLVNYRNQIVKGKIKPNSTATNQWARKLLSGQINVQDSGPQNVRIPLDWNSSSVKLMNEKVDLVGLYKKTFVLETHIPQKGQTNSSLEDFDNAAKNMSKTYHIPIQLTPI